MWLTVVVTATVVLSVVERADSFFISSPICGVSSASTTLLTSTASPAPCSSHDRRGCNVMRAEVGPVTSRLRRKQLISSAALTLGTALLGLNPPGSIAEDVDFGKVREDIERIIDEDAAKGPTLVRLAWHSSGTYDKISRSGGSQGGTMRFENELGDGANAGLSNAVKWLEPIKKKYPSVSYGDLYTLAGVTAVEKAGGPKITWRYGRKDNAVASVPPGGRLPAADRGNPTATAQGLRDVFYRMGFDDREIVALSGAHALGRCHPNFSGYEGPWTPTPNQFAGSIYFKLLKNVKWTERKNFTPFQYENPSGSLMMLPSDIVLLQDSKFKKYVDMYAADDKLFFEDFAKAFSTLLELGTRDLKGLPT